MVVMVRAHSRHADSTNVVSTLMFINSVDYEFLKKYTIIKVMLKLIVFSVYYGFSQTYAKLFKCGDN